MKMSKTYGRVKFMYGQVEF